MFKLIQYLLHFPEMEQSEQIKNFLIIIANTEKEFLI